MADKGDVRKAQSLCMASQARETGALGWAAPYLIDWDGGILKGHRRRHWKNSKMSPVGTGAPYLTATVLPVLFSL